MTDSTTKTTESGAFIRTTIRHGRARKQTTRRMTPNDEKVILGHIADFEVYVYPYKYPDSIFVGYYPTSTVLTSSNTSELLNAYNKARWYLKGEGLNEPSWRIAPNSRRRAIVKAYNSGLNRLQTSNNARKRL